MSEVYKALADPTRRRILQLLRERQMNAGEIAEHFDLAKPTLSGHFAVLREAGLVTPAKAGTTITYHLNVSVLEEALLALMDAFKLQEQPAQPLTSHGKSKTGDAR
jgi:DNA-binding transcriptional ArsR family regulator